ncbi:hypothetical protein PHISP_05900 [Aspergillus sp. HF37]|nr:hypothetical protein PHISP_05900 [Aspergillus sp. HF37]
MLKKTLPPLFFWHSTPTSTPELSPASSSSDTDSDGDMDAAASRPRTLAIQSGAYCPSRPSLADVLSNTAPPPYTLSSFMAYLSQNHCLETLEFTLDAKRYRESHESLAHQLAESPITTDCPETKRLRMLWHRLLTAYIFPGSPREINLPSEVRDEILLLANAPSPPSPQKLDRAVKLIHELMEESIFFPFLNSHAGPGATPVDRVFGSSENVSVVTSPGLDEHAGSRAHPVKRKASAGDLVSGGHHSARSNFPLSAITTLGKGGRSTGPVSSSSADSGSGPGSAALTDDSGSLQSSPISSPSPGELMTPPTTPPASVLAGSPKNRPENPWKKMGMKLGFMKRSARDLEE